MTKVHTLDRVVIRFAGDSGDGMQLTGDRFTADSAVFGNDISTLPNFPAEIRAPAGTLPGVSSFQLHFANYDIMTPGDRPDVLVAMNPAALKANIADLPRGGVIIADTADFTKRNLAKVGYDANPLEDESLADYQVHALDLTGMTVEAVKQFGLSRKDASRAKNMFALGLLSWLYHRPTEGTLNFLSAKFASKPAIRDANITAFKTGYAFGETTETFAVTYEVAPAPMPAGRYRQISGNLALAYGLVTAAQEGRAAAVPGRLPDHPGLGRAARAEQAQALRGDHLPGRGRDRRGRAPRWAPASPATSGVTTTSGPGISLKSETIALGVMTELPLVVCDIQRAGPSTGMPTKTEQADLLQVMFGRNGEAPGAGAGRPVARRLLPHRDRGGADRGQVPHPGDRAVRRLHRQRRRAVAGAGRRGDPADRPAVRRVGERGRQGRQPGLPALPARPGDAGPAVGHPGHRRAAAPDRRHREGQGHRRGLLRPGQPRRDGADPGGQDRRHRPRHPRPGGRRPGRRARAGTARVLVLGWGSTYGPIVAAVRRVRKTGRQVAYTHLRHLNPFPANLGEILRRYDRVIVPEMNLGQLALLLRAQYLVDVQSYSRVRGLPISLSELARDLEAEIDQSKECRRDRRRSHRPEPSKALRQAQGTTPTAAWPGCPWPWSR